MIRLKVFKDVDSLSDAVVALLRAHLSPSTDPDRCRAVMLAGGSTPLAAYEKIRQSPFPVGADLRLLFSDDRHVPAEDSKSNYGNTLPMIRALGIPDHRVLRVHGELTLDDSVARFESDLRALVGGGCRISLGLLGLGADGHTASLFSAAHIAAAKERLALGVDRPDGMQGVSVTPDFLARVGQIVFVVAGADKRAVLQKLLRETSSIPAGLAVQRNSCVEVWCDVAAGGNA
jgi:6-phosphogluconolactonase